MPRERPINIMEKSSMSTVSENKGFAGPSGHRVPQQNAKRLRIGSAVHAPAVAASIYSDAVPDSMSKHHACMKSNIPLS